jgi:hypothetical protein
VFTKSLSSTSKSEVDYASRQQALATRQRPAIEQPSLDISGHTRVPDRARLVETGTNLHAYEHEGAHYYMTGSSRSHFDNGSLVAIRAIDEYSIFEEDEGMRRLVLLNSKDT